LPQANTSRWRTVPIACTLSSDQLQQRAAQWRSALRGATRTTIPDGLRFTLPIHRAAAIADLAAAEQHRCAFFDFRLHLDGADLHLEVRAPDDAAAFLSDLFAHSADADAVSGSGSV
jgi:MerR family transcriptional regulator, copper efflux regulator